MDNVTNQDIARHLKSLWNNEEINIKFKKKFEEGKKFKKLLIIAVANSIIEEMQDRIEIEIEKVIDLIPELCENITYYNVTEKLEKEIQNQILDDAKKFITKIEYLARITFHRKIIGEKTVPALIRELKRETNVLDFLDSISNACQYVNNEKANKYNPKKPIKETDSSTKKELIKLFKGKEEDMHECRVEAKRLLENPIGDADSSTPQAPSTPQTTSTTQASITIEGINLKQIEPENSQQKLKEAQDKLEVAQKEYKEYLNFTENKLKIHKNLPIELINKYKELTNQAKESVKNAKKEVTRLKKLILSKQASNNGEQEIAIANTTTASLTPTPSPRTIMSSSSLNQTNGCTGGGAGRGIRENIVAPNNQSNNQRSSLTFRDAITPKAITALSTGLLIAGISLVATGTALSGGAIILAVGAAVLIGLGMKKCMSSNNNNNNNNNNNTLEP